MDCRAERLNGIAEQWETALGEGSSAWSGLRPAAQALLVSQLRLPTQGSFHRRQAHPSDLPQCRWINALLGNLKASFSGTFPAFNLNKYARCYLGGYRFCFNRRFLMVATMSKRIANALCCWMPCTRRNLRIAEAYG